MKKKIVCFIVLTIVVILSSCNLTENLIIEMDKKTFEVNRTYWNNQNMKNYQFTYDYFSSSGPLGPVTITIRENNETIIENENEFNQNIIAESISEIFDFISGTFDFIESVKNGSYFGHEIQKISLKIEYHSQYRFPTKVNLSTFYVKDVIGGAYYTLNITDFKTIN